MRRTGVLLAGLLVAALGAAAAVAETNATTVTVRAKEFTLTPSTKTTKAGKVTFVVRNVGKVQHEMVVIRTNVAPGKLPVNAKGRAIEKGAVGEVGDVRPGQTKRATLTLTAGKYVLLCNLPGHYKAGQYSAFVVR